MSDILRIIDANVNRACEGLRVCEEIFRFLNDDKDSAEQLKNLRHNIVEAVNELPHEYTEFLAARESAADVGNDLAVTHGTDFSAENVFMKNMKRAQEAVRCLEEFSKFSEGKSSAMFQKVRFSLYQAEKELIKKILK